MTRELLFLSCMVALAVSVSAQPATRPVLGFGGDVEAMRKAAAWALALSPEALAAQVQPPGKMAERDFASTVEQLVGLAKTTGDASCRIRAAAMLKAALGDLAAAPVDKLTVMIDERGVLNPGNLRLRDAAYQLALLAYVGDDSNAASRSIAILRRFADVLSKWPIVDREGKTHLQHDKSYYAQWDANGLWGVWFMSDMDASTPVLRAWDLLCATPEMKASGAREHIEKGFLRYIVEHNFEYPPEYGNLEHYIFRGLARFGRVLPEPEYIHRMVQWYEATMKVNFYADGFWHEGSPSYHKDICVGMTRTVPAMLKDYSDPPGFISKLDGTRFDHLDMVKRYELRHQRLWDALNKVSLPSRICAVIHDTAFQQEVWWAPPLKESRSQLLGCMGHALLGAGESANQVQAHLHFSGTHGHEHYDCLSILLFAAGRELLSDTQYRPLPGDISTREWHAATVGHNTVVIDERDQENRLQGARRKLTEDDLVPGIPNWRYRDYGHGDKFNDGKLRVFATDFPEAQVVEAEGERSYDPAPQLYRRTLFLVKAGQVATYVVDVFRVQGGKVHDWMLHGCLEAPYQLTTLLPMTPRPGALHKYLSDLREGSAEKDWTADFAVEKGPTCRVHMMGMVGAKGITGQGPAMRRMGKTGFLDVRHEGGESCFVAVHEPFAREPVIDRVEFADLGEMAVAVRVHLRNGDVDTVVSTADEAPYRERAWPTWRLTFKGHVGHVRESAIGGWAYLIRGDRMKVGARAVSGATPAMGVVKATTRREDGADRDTFVTDARIPADGMTGKTLICDLGELLVQSFPIDGIEQEGDSTVILTHDDPGMTIRGDLIKLEHFPCWGLRGQCRFTIDRPVLVR